jgi:hypothetical protein
MITCPECGHENEEWAVNCADCGILLPGGMQGANVAKQEQRAEPEQSTSNEVKDTTGAIACGVRFIICMLAIAASLVLFFTVWVSYMMSPPDLSLDRYLGLLLFGGAAVLLLIGGIVGFIMGMRQPLGSKPSDAKAETEGEDAEGQRM